MFPFCCCCSGFCFFYYSLVVYLEIKDGNSSISVLIFHDCFNYPGSFCFCMSSEIIFFFLWRITLRVGWRLSWICGLLLVGWAFFTALILPIHDCGTSFWCVLQFLFFSILKFPLYKSFRSLVIFIPSFLHPLTPRSSKHRESFTPILYQVISSGILLGDERRTGDSMQSCPGPGRSPFPHPLWVRMPPSPGGGIGGSILSLYNW